MSSIDFAHDTPLHRVRAREATEFRILFTATYPFFLAAGLVKRVLPKDHVTSARKSIFAEARAAANTCIPFVFMR